MENERISCPKCKSKEAIKRGYRITENRGNIQRYSCKNCKQRFVLNDGFYRMRNNDKKITLCMDLFFNGMSTRKIQSHLQAFYPHNSNHSTILRWIRKYSLMIAGFTDKLKIATGKELQVDEMEYKTKGKQSWFIDSIDTKTRYMVSSEYVKSRGQKEITKVLKLAKQKTENKIKIITTDGLMTYVKCLNKSFNYNQHHKKNPKIIHNRVNASKGEGFNFKIERLHNSIRERTKVFRGFKNLKSAYALMKGYEVYYNFIRVHQGINKCPYELAVPELKLEGVNRWLELIRLSNS